ncbi:phospholipase A2-like [Microplitis mediator]|uniref:phospholipase A2-like n=1 Tax=Microplitis mediator TaxID=375433 RepID=UPI002557C27D|nr:phospholipase A2-like [Microplitis mediator]
MVIFCRPSVCFIIIISMLSRYSAEEFVQGMLLNNLTRTSEINYLINRFNNNVTINEPTHFLQKRELIFPGTLWCGVGNVAIDDNDLGNFFVTDACCRDHELCGLNYTNEMLDMDAKQDIVTKFLGKSVCPCERDFYTCLRRARTILARKFGKLYFNVLRPQCYIYDHPKMYCVRYQGILQLRCLQYRVDTSAKKRVELRDNPFFF